MINRGKYMYVNNVYDNYLNYKGTPFDVIEYEARSGKFQLCEVADLASFATFPLNKILTASNPHYLQENYQAMMPLLKTIIIAFLPLISTLNTPPKELTKPKRLRPS